jgi:hypothetical protein
VAVEAAAAAAKNNNNTIFKASKCRPLNSEFLF